MDKPDFVMAPVRGRDSMQDTAKGIAIVLVV
jgi:hypothetical protein